MPSEHEPSAEVDQDDGGEELLNEEADVHFEPIVRLEAVEVKTLEEDEEPTFTRRTRLYRYDNKTSEWKERGTGELKLLKHKETKTIRVLMRREKTLKICANHRVSPQMELKPHQGSNRTWMYGNAWAGKYLQTDRNIHTLLKTLAEDARFPMCSFAFLRYTCPADFSDGEPRHEVFAMRFKDKDDCDEFRKCFDHAKTHNASLLGETEAGVDKGESSSSSSSSSSSDDESESDPGSHGAGEENLASDLARLDVTASKSS